MEDETQVVITRPSSTALLGISSNDRYKTFNARRTTPTNPFNFIIQKNESIMSGFFKRIALTEMRLNWTLPNFAQAWGNTSIIVNYKSSYGGTTQSFLAVIQDGFYGSAELAVALAEALNNGGYSTNPSTPTTFVSGINGAVVSVLGTLGDDQMVFVVPSPYTLWFSPIPSQTSRQLYDMLALPLVSSPGLQPIFTGVPDLRATAYVDLVCRQPITWRKETRHQLQSHAI